MSGKTGSIGSYCASIVICSAGVAVSTSASAAILISSAATANMNCSGGVCMPTAKGAVVNAGDLETLLGSGGVTVTTTGSGVEADDIRVITALTWSSSNALALEAHRSIAINAAVSVAGQSGLTLDTGKKGALTFGKRGHASFASLSSQLTINGGAYRLVGDIKTLASDVANSPSGNFALAANYNAGADGTYGSSPVPTTFTGTFEGLGNGISNLSINDPTDNHFVGLFAQTSSSGILRDVGLPYASISGARGVKLHLAEAIGTLVGVNDGSIYGCWASGKASGGRFSFVGGLVGENDGALGVSYASVTITSGTLTLNGGLVGQSTGTIANAHATGKIRSKTGFAGGGLVGSNLHGSITLSYATGEVEGSLAGGLVGETAGGNITYSFATGDVTTIENGGGLTGENGSAVSNSYATGSVLGVPGNDVGGFAAETGGAEGPISDSYSTGEVAAEGQPVDVGGFLGFEGNPGDIADSYWDLDTSGITDPSQGAGNIANDPGITGLTTEQLQSGLPPGFDPAVWGENPGINGGLPYLLANPPPK